MDKESLIARINEIGTCEDDVRRRELLTELQEEAEKDYDERSSLITDNETLVKDNEKLRTANMKLFLKIGEPKTPEEIAKAKGEEIPPSEEKMDFKDLFDEKGNLK